MSQEEHQHKIDILKFPSTAHLYDLGGSAVTRDDLLIDSPEDFLEPVELVVEEKVDGANIGISYDDEWNLRVQNRSHYVSKETHAQFATLDTFLENTGVALADILGQERILFGEWLYAQHSVPYTSLPSTFLAFDILDKQSGEWLSSDKRDELLADTGIHSVRRVCKRSFSGKDDFEQLLETEKSAFYDGPMEGVYLRVERDGLTIARAKVVRADFVQGITDQWTKKGIVKNGVDW